MQSKSVVGAKSSQTDDIASHNPSTIGRILFGLGLALQASEDFRDMDETIEYAESTDVPLPELLAPLASGMMFLSGLGVVL